MTFSRKAGESVQLGFLLSSVPSLLGHLVPPTATPWGTSPSLSPKDQDLLCSPGMEGDQASGRQELRTRGDLDGDPKGLGVSNGEKGMPTPSLSTGGWLPP